MVNSLCHTCFGLFYILTVVCPHLQDPVDFELSCVCLALCISLFCNIGDLLKLEDAVQGKSGCTVQSQSFLIMPQFLSITCLKFSASLLYSMTNTTLSFVCLRGFHCTNVCLSKSFALVYAFLRMMF